jgi:chloride channel protein, CIC family
VQDLPDDEPVTRIATADVVSVEPTDNLLTVLECITEEGVDHVPVVEDGRLLGICTRTDLLQARSQPSSTSGDRQDGGPSSVVRCPTASARRLDDQARKPTG